MQVKTIVTGAFSCNNYLLINESTDQGVLIDCGDDADLLMDIIDKSGIRLSAVLLTHGHADHIAAVDQLCKRYSCPVYAHQSDLTLLKRALYNLSLQVLGRAMSVGCEPILLKGGEELVLAGIRIKVIPTPGHTMGSVCYLTDEGLFTGDTLLEGSVGGEFPPFGNLRLEIESIKNRLLTLKENYICYPGHGNKTSLWNERQNNLYLKG